MSPTEVFDWLGDRIGQRASLSRTEARGLLRVALRDVGLQPEGLTVKQAQLLLAHGLEPALTRVKVPKPQEVCLALRTDLEGARFAAAPTEDAADVFGRLGKR